MVEKRKKASAHTDENGYYFLKFTVRDDEINENGYVLNLKNVEEYFYCQDILDSPPTLRYIGKPEPNTSHTRNYILPVRSTLDLRLSEAVFLDDADKIQVSIQCEYGDREYCHQSISWNTINRGKTHSVVVGGDGMAHLTINRYSADELANTMYTSIFILPDQPNEYVVSELD